MRRKLNRRFFLVTVLAVCLTLVLTAGICYEMFRTQVMEDLGACAHLLAAEGTVLPDEAASLGQDGLRVTMISPQGGVLYDTDASATQMESHLNRPEVQQALQTGEGSAVRRSPTLGKNTFYYAVRTADGNVLRVAKDAHGILLVFAKALPAAFAAGAVLIVLGTVLSRQLSRSFVAPIERLAHDMDGAGEGEAVAYPELVPLMDTIRSQHEAIVKNADMRQEFTANVSHELKTPLAAISGYSELIASGMAKGEDAKRFSEEIHKSADRLLTLINDVIRLSELDAQGVGRAGETVELLAMARECADLLDFSASKRGVTVTVEGTPAHVRAARRDAEELIYNLCDNAIRYNKEHGSVTVTVHNTPAGARLCVRDTGIGIAEQHRERVFERFYRVDKSRSKETGGTGLGLAIVKHIAAGIGAQLSLESQVGVGTAITVQFPPVQQAGR